MENQLETTKTTSVQSAKNMNIKQLMSNETIKKKFEEILGKGANSFISSVTTLATTTALQGCDPMTILSSAIAGASLNLPVNPTLGFACIVPFNSKSGKQAQFQIMTKGFLQLALRSGQFLKINVNEVCEGVYKGVNVMTGDIDFSGEKKSDKIIGYVAYFQLINGFEKSLFMTKEQVENHAKKYSKTYNNTNSVWKLDFDAMAEKTVLKRLLSKYAPLSLEMQTAVLSDQSKVNLNENLEVAEFEYIDNETVAETVAEEIKTENASVEINVPENSVKQKETKKVVYAEQKEILIPEQPQDNVLEFDK